MTKDRGTVPSPNFSRWPRKGGRKQKHHVHESEAVGGGGGWEGGNSTDARRTLRPKNPARACKIARGGTAKKPDSSVSEKALAIRPVFGNMKRKAKSSWKFGGHRVNPGFPEGKRCHENESCEQPERAGKQTIQKKNWPNSRRNNSREGEKNKQAAGQPRSPKRTGLPAWSVGRV